MTFHVHFVENNEISVPPRHSVRSTGWPLVFFILINIAVQLLKIEDIVFFVKQLKCLACNMQRLEDTLER